MIVQTSDEIEKVKKACVIVREILEGISEIIKPGISTYDIDELAYEMMKKREVVPAFKDYGGFPANICVSINEEVVHGIPKKERILKEGDIVSVDIGVIYDGFYGDCADTFPVGEIKQIHKKLIDVTKKAFYIGVDYIKDGVMTGDIGNSIQQFVESNGFSVVKAFAGHGIGKKLHDFPELANFGNKGEGEILKDGMVICIEPMVNEGTWKVKILDDGWTAITSDRKYSAHYENEVLVRKEKGEILS
ncbi:MAG TPA: type I methionyl aminopeptidase [Candidatus Ratteibacteria bacterium]|nr:type I methionyl aminopeptidase [bacterium]HRR95661.1 type I methionyl aminopeptidase [Candidatus Ratteibacteria bacterium]